MNLSGGGRYGGPTPKGFNPKPPNVGDLMQTVPANAGTTTNTAECGHDLSLYCTCMADELAAEVDADFGPDDALREYYGN